jgi:hypothetical protein
MNRRGFLGAALVAACAPAVVRSGVLMPVVQPLWTPHRGDTIVFRRWQPYDVAAHDHLLDAIRYGVVAYGVGVVASDITIQAQLGLNIERRARLDALRADILTHARDTIKLEHITRERWLR